MNIESFRNVVALIAGVCVLIMGYAAGTLLTNDTMLLRCVFVYSFLSALMLIALSRW